MVIVEKSFPRGGIPAAKEKAAAQHETQIFGAVQRKVKKDKSKSTRKGQEASDDKDTFSAVPLNAETLQDGMVIMGIIKKVDQLYLNVSLPGRINARVSALEISESYTKATKEFLQNSGQSDGYKPLNDLYRPGQMVYGRIQEIKNNSKGHTVVDMTFKPAEVHHDLNHSNIRKGFVFNGAVEEVQEHGYIIESGIKGLRCFVPMDKSKPDHAIGEMIYLKVEKMTTDKSVSTSICKEVKAGKLKIKDQNEPNLDYLLPGTIVNFQVSKHLKDGLKGTIMNEVFPAYVNELQLNDIFAVPEDYEINDKYEGRILYVMPLTKLVYLTLKLRNNEGITDNEAENKLEDANALKRGDIVETAVVHHMGTGGIVLTLNEKCKGILTFKTIKTNCKGNYDQDELLTKYGKESRHKVRIVDYDIMESVYICTDDIAMVNEKFFALEDFHPGDFVTAKIKEYNEKIGGYTLQIGMVTAIIEKLYLAPSVKILPSNTQLKCRVVAVSLERKVVYLTNRPEYLSKTCSLLTTINAAKINGNFMGTVVKCNASFALVKFFGDVKGVFYRQNSSPGQLENMDEGQTMQFRVASKNEEQLTLGLVENAFKLGEICPVTIWNKLESGLEIKVAYGSEEGEEIEFKGLIPIRLLSDHIDLLRAKLQMYQIGDETKAVCIADTIFSIRDVQYFTEHLTYEWKSINVGDVLKSYVKDINEDVIDLIVPINGYKKSVKVHLNMLLMNVDNSTKVNLAPDQVVYVKVLGKVDSTKTISVSAILTDVWNGQLSVASNMFESYLQEVNDIKKTFKKQGAAIGRVSPGDKVTAHFRCVNAATNDWEYVLDKFEITGIVKSWLVGKAKAPSEGTSQECVILWVDYSNQLVFLSNKSGEIEHISNGKDIPPNLVGKGGIAAKVLFKNESVFVCSLKKGKQPIVFCPTQLHFNDFEKSASAAITEGQFCKLTFIHESKPIAVLDDTYKIWLDVCRKRKLQNDSKDEVNAKKAKIEKLVALENERKRKLSDSKASATEKKPKQKLKATPDEDTKSPVLFYEDKTPDKKAAAKVVSVPTVFEANKTIKSSEKPVTKSLAGINDFWTTDLTNISKTNDSSEEDTDEDDDKTNDNKSKKKLTVAEKFKQQREEEARLRAIEEKYADPNQLPDSVDQFDRLVLSDPNNSKHWINYMVFHLQSTEIDKARAVARRALKTITFRNTDEQINIWVALLNLELRYGSKETFNDTLKEALMYNEPLKVYLRTVEIITDAQKNQELIEMIGVITKKFKIEPEMWKVAANAYFTMNMAERAQQLLHKALACLPERDHVNTIVVFANLNHKHGNSEMAQTLLDQVVTSYPKRVDVWCQYVDMLIKEDIIDSARNILERAVVQKIPLRKMRTIFKKYLEFEERFGTEANVQRVKQLAMDYVKKNENL